MWSQTRLLGGEKGLLPVDNKVYLLLEGGVDFTPLSSHHIPVLIWISVVVASAEREKLEILNIYACLFKAISA